MRDGDVGGGQGRRTRAHPLAPIKMRGSAAYEVGEGHMISYCRDCKRETIWKRGRALLNRLFVHQDFGGQYSGEDVNKAETGQTMSRSGRPKLVLVRKCEDCGRSITE